MFEQAYAEIYDRIGQSVFSMHMARQVLAWISTQNNRHPPHALRVLDLACGTGAAACAFAQAGCQVVGVDLSQAMLTQARRTSENAGLSIKWLHADIRWLTPALLTEQDIPFPFDLITCFNSLPYLYDHADLRQVCAAVVPLLRPGGHWVFDLTGETKFTTEDTVDRVLYSSADYMVYQRLSYDPEQRRGQRRIGWFTREIDRWWRTEETYLEHCWRDSEVEEALTSADPCLQIVMRQNSDHVLAHQPEPCTVYYVQRP